jgi:hypothetical protein
VVLRRHADLRNVGKEQPDAGELDDAGGQAGEEPYAAFRAAYFDAYAAYINRRLTLMRNLSAPSRTEI